MTIDQQIAEMKREIALRKNVFPKWVAAGKMRQAESDHGIAAMTAALHTVMALKERAPTRAAVRTALQSADDLLTVIEPNKPGGILPDVWNATRALIREAIAGLGS